MPFRVNPKNKKCVQVKKSGKWQHKGCTDGPVKKYLAALYANTKDVNESQDDFDWAKEISSDIEKNIGFRYNIPLENKKNEYYLIWFKKPGIEKEQIRNVVNYIQNNTVWKFWRPEEAITTIFDYYNDYGSTYITLKPFNANRYSAGYGVMESAFRTANNGMLFSDVENIIEILPEKNNINESEDDWYGDLLKDLGTKEWQIYFDEINDLLKGSQFEILVSRNPDVGLVIKLKKKDDFIFIDAWSEKFFKPHNVWKDISALIRYYETSSNSEYYNTLLELYELLIPFFRKHRVLGNVLEESSDDDWWADIVKSPLDILKFKGKEIMIDIRNLEADRLEQLINIIKQYSTTNSCLNKALTNPSIITISLHCAHEESDYQPEPGYVCCLRNTYEEELNNDEINLDLITPLKGDHILSFYLNESKDDFDWVDDIVNSFQEKVLVTIDNWDRFKNIKVVRGPDWEWGNQDNHSYGYIEDLANTLERDDNWVVVYWLDGGDNIYRIGPENYDLYFDFSNKEDKNLIKEGVYDRITGKAVKDIMHILNDITDDPEKETEYFFSLPEENDDFSEYEQDNLQFSVDLIVRYDENINNGFEVLSSVTQDENVNIDNTYNDEYDDDEYNDYNVLSIIITLDPKAGKTFFDKIYYKLNEDIRHEIEHLKQEGPNAVPGRPKPKLFKKTFYHHKNLAEIPALVRGFYRRAKLERRPIDEIMIEDLDKEVKTGSLTEDEKESLLQIWIDYSKRNLPSAIYKFF